MTASNGNYGFLKSNVYSVTLYGVGVQYEKKIVEPRKSNILF
jgi:hypothetical protein